ncbi:hypothetical protein RB595_008608 [Gaeumannomyces hyphopodioides]
MDPREIQQAVVDLTSDEWQPARRFIRLNNCQRLDRLRAMQFWQPGQPNQLEFAVELFMRPELMEAMPQGCSVEWVRLKVSMLPDITRLLETCQPHNPPSRVWEVLLQMVSEQSMMHDRVMEMLRR